MEKMSDHELEILYARAKAKLYAKLETIKSIRISAFPTSVSGGGTAFSGRSG